MYNSCICPVCKSEKIDCWKKYSFVKPAEDIDFSGPLVDYKLERIAVLFETINVSSDIFEPAIYYCDSCGFVFQNPRFSEEDTEKFHDFLNLHSIPDRRQKQRPILKKEERARRVYNYVDKYIKNVPSKILDFGGMHGFNLLDFCAKGHICDLVDYIQIAVPEPIRYLGSRLGELPESEEDKYDVILLSHVLEHAADPLGLVNYLKGYLRMNGVLYVEVPLGCKSEWKKIAEPATHCNFFSEQSLCNVLTMAGLNVVAIESKKQWVTHDELECINAICVNEVPNKQIKFKKTIKQVENQDSLTYKAKWWLSSPIKNSKRLFNKYLK